MGENKAKCVYLNVEKNSNGILDVTTTLAVPLHVEEYGCGLVSVQGSVNTVDAKTKKLPLYLCTDVCEDSNVDGIKIPVLRQLIRNPKGMVNDVNNIIWLRVNRPIIRNVRLYISDNKGELVSLSSGWLSCTLLFIPK